MLVVMSQLRSFWHCSVVKVTYHCLPYLGRLHMNSASCSVKINHSKQHERSLASPCKYCTMPSFNALITEFCGIKLIIEKTQKSASFYLANTCSLLCGIYHSWFIQVSLLPWSRFQSADSIHAINLLTSGLFTVNTMWTY